MVTFNPDTQETEPDGDPYIANLSQPEQYDGALSRAGVVAGCNFIYKVLGLIPSPLLGLSPEEPFYPADLTQLTPCCGTLFSS